MSNWQQRRLDWLQIVLPTNKVHTEDADQSINGPVWCLAFFTLHVCVLALTRTRALLL